MIRKWSQEEKEEICLDFFVRKFFRDKILPSLIQTYAQSLLISEPHKEEIFKRVKERCEKEFISQKFVEYEISRCAASLNNKEMILLKLIIENDFLTKLEQIFTNKTFHNSIVKFILNKCHEEQQKEIPMESTVPNMWD